MINIETVDDVRILKELTKNNDSEKIKELKQEMLQVQEALEEQIVDLTDTIRKQDILIENLREVKPLTRTDVQKMISDAVTAQTAPMKPKKVVRKKATDNEEFKITPGLMKHKIVSPYNEIYLQGNTLINKSKNNHVNELPISTLQLLLIVEKFNANKMKIYEKQAKDICNLCDISRNQFAKVYYNLKERNFYDVLEAIDKEVKQTNFRCKDGFIYIKKQSHEYNTKIDTKKFRELLNIYINSNTPYLTIYKLSLENKDVNPIFLLAVLKRNNQVLKAIEGK